MNEKPRILHVDDEGIVRMVTSDVLGEKYLVISAVDAKEGYQKAASGQFDLIILDIIMPGENGIQLFKRIRGLDQYKNTPCIFYTGGTPGIDLHQEIGDLVANHGNHVRVLTKPCGINFFLTHVEDSLAGKPPETYFPIEPVRR